MARSKTNTKGVGSSKRRRKPAADQAADPSKTGAVGPKTVVTPHKPPTLGSRVKQGRKVAYQSKGGRIAKNLGKGWQRKVYGKGYQLGTVKKDNERINKSQANRKSVSQKIAALKSSLARGGDKTAVEKRLATAEANAKTVTKNLTTTKNSRDKFLGLRDQELKKLSNMTPTEKKRLRERAASKTLNKHIEPASTAGGVTAPSKKKKKK